eukprot:s288_g29.t1
MAAYGDISSYSARVRRKAVRPGLDLAIIHPLLAASWTEHSERATLPTGLALLQAPKEERDMLGRWKPDGSDTYIRMYNGVVSRLQLKFAKAARKNDRSKTLDEKDIIENAMSWISERCEMLDDEGLGNVLHHLEDSLASLVLSGWIPADEDAVETEAVQPDQVEQTVTVETTAAVGNQTREARKPLFVVVNNGKKCKRLHKSIGGCWMGREMDFKSSTEFFTLPEASEYTHYCTRALTMAAIGPEALEEALKKGSSDLRFMLSRNDVTDHLQASFFNTRITTMQKFSSFFRSENDLIDVLRDSFNTDSAQGLESRAEVASVICSWRETQTKQERQAEVEAEMDTREWTQPIPTGDYITLRNAFMKVYGKIEDRVTPAKEYLERRLQELENGEFRAESMSEVVSKDEVDPEVMVPIFDS